MCDSKCACGHLRESFTFQRDWQSKFSLREQDLSKDLKGERDDPKRVPEEGTANARVLRQKLAWHV